jgi:AcrR family transcriptional regulator
MTRKYEKKRRAELEEATRARIAAVTSDLHEEVGPARTTIKAIAERAGVTRPTVYKHFPDEVSLFAACSAHFVASNPPPDISAWPAIADPDERLRRALADMYAYYGRTEAMTGNVMRDAEAMPALRAVLDQGWQPFLDAAYEILGAGWGARGARRRRLLAAIDLALDFGTWQRLVRTSGLSDREAIDLMTNTVRAAAGQAVPPGAKPRSPGA